MLASSDALDDPAAAIPAPLGRRALAWLHPPARSAPALGAVLVAGLTLTLGVPLGGMDTSLAPGSPSPRDFKAPRPLSYESRVRTEEARAASAARVAPVFELDQRVAERQVQRARDVMQLAGRLRALPAYAESDDGKRAWLSDIPELTGLMPPQADLLLGLGPGGAMAGEAWDKVGGEVTLVVAQAMRQRVREDNRTAVIEQLVNRVDPRMENDQAQLVATIAASFVTVNTIENIALTERQRQAARDATETIKVAYARGETIVREGEMLTAAHVEALAQAGLLAGAFSWRRLLALSCLLTALVAVLAAGLSRLEPGFWRRTRPLALVVALVLAFTFGARFMVTSPTPHLVHAYPAAAVAMTVSVLLGAPTGLMAAILLAVAVGLLGGPRLDTACYVLLGGLAGSIALGRAERMKAFLVAAVAVWATDLAVILGFEFMNPALILDQAPQWAGVALVNAALSSGLAALGVLAAGSLFGVTTSIQLLELMRPDHPLLHELQLKAPGTYQHSIVLANLGEAASKAIGADALLTRVGAYYHDIGKLARPYFFIENQLGGVNPHDGLDPFTSARIVIDHVADGAALVRGHALPEAVVQFIWQHHGTLRAEYFYRAALAHGGAAAVDEDLFRYPGPRPQSRESAIIMLADATEAIVRAHNPHSAEEIDAIVRDVLQQRLESGQLDDTDLTLRDLRRVHRAFVHTLRSMYHPRVKYPAGVKPKARRRRGAADP